MTQNCRRSFFNSCIPYNCAFKTAVAWQTMKKNGGWAIFIYLVLAVCGFVWLRFTGLLQPKMSEIASMHIAQCAKANNQYNVRVAP